MAEAAAFGHVPPGQREGYDPGGRGQAGQSCQGVQACRHCLTPLAMEERQGRLVSNLKNGVCRDREACESRQPPLIPLEEL